MIPAGTLLTTTPPQPVEVVLPYSYVDAWVQDAPAVVTVTPRPEGETSALITVETWLDGCHDCQHSKSSGFRFAVTSFTSVLTNSGDFVPVTELMSGFRLKSLTCKSGFEVVRDVWPIYLVEPVRMYSVDTDNYGITDGKHMVFLRG